MTDGGRVGTRKDKAAHKDKARGDTGGLLPGSVFEQFIKCGKAQCRCAQGELHGPYYYRVWRDEGRTVQKVYVKRDELEQVRAQCARHKAITEEFRAFCVQAEALTALLRVQAARSRRLRAALAGSLGKRLVDVMGTVGGE